MHSKSETAFTDLTWITDEQKRTGTPYLAGILRSPLKSAAALYSDSAFIASDGIRGAENSLLSDRSFMIIDSTGKLISQRQKAKMARIQTDTIGGVLTCSIAGEPERGVLRVDPVMLADDAHIEHATTVHTTEGIPGIDQGDEAAKWFSDFLGEEVRLVFQKPSEPRERTERAPGFEDAPTVLKFQDSYPVTALSYSVLSIFNRKLNESRPDFPQFDPSHFRMNLLLGGDINEHIAIGNYLQVGAAIFYIERAKERCPMPAVDPTLGKMREPRGLGSLYQAELAKMHIDLGIPADERVRETSTGKIVNRPLLGVDLIPVKEGHVSVGDTVKVVGV